MREDTLQGFAVSDDRLQPLHEDCRVLHVHVIKLLWSGQGLNFDNGYNS